ncbi:unnamed protein product, partial [Symbiodinium microadriaticum]
AEAQRPHAIPFGSLCLIHKSGHRDGSLQANDAGREVRDFIHYIARGGAFLWNRFLIGQGQSIQCDLAVQAKGSAKISLAETSSSL